MSGEFRYVLISNDKYRSFLRHSLCNLATKACGEVGCLASRNFKRPGEYDHLTKKITVWIAVALNSSPC